MTGPLIDTSCIILNKSSDDELVSSVYNMVCCQVLVTFTAQYALMPRKRPINTFTRYIFVIVPRYAMAIEITWANEFYFIHWSY